MESKKLNSALGMIFAAASMSASATPITTGVKLAASLAANSIIGGAEMPDSDPLSKTVVAVYDLQGALCSGTLIAQNVVVTAAHCVTAIQGNELYQKPTESIVVVFSPSIQNVSKQTVRRASNITVNPDYPNNILDKHDHGDLALIEFGGDLPEGYAPARLLTDSSWLAAGTEVRLAGYGITDGVTKDGDGTLRYVDVSIKQAYGQSEVVLDQTEGKGACHGDSGGPAFVLADNGFQLWGVTSRGVADPSNTCGTYSVYTNLVPYLGWIQQTVQAAAAN